jgi:lipooligosaccharide transport system permease protein
MKMFSWRFFRMWQRNRDVFMRLWHSEAPGTIIEPIIVLVAMGLGLGAYVGLVDNQDYITFIVPGIVCSYAMFSVFGECTYGTFFRMEERKTFDAIIATPLSVEDVIAGEIFWGATRSLMTGTVILLVALTFQQVDSWWTVLIPLLSFYHGIMFSAIAIFFTSVAPSFYIFNHVFTLFVTPMFFLSGVFFPLTEFPQIVQNLSWIAPLTPVVHLTRALFEGEFHVIHAVAAVYILLVTIVFFWLSLVLMRRRLTV